MRFTDRERVAEITMRTWDGESWGQDFSADILTDGKATYIDMLDAYLVNDLDYVIDYAKDWKAGTGDFYGCGAGESDELVIDVTEIVYDKEKNMDKIKAIGKMELPATHATKVMDPHAQAQQLVVWEIDGERYVVISANTRGTMEFTKLSDLYVDSFDGTMKARRAPLRIKKADVDTRVFTDELPVLDPVTVPASPVTSDAQLRASAKYDADHTTQIKLKLNDKTDADILAKLDSVGNKQGYIKSLIRQDIES